MTALTQTTMGCPSGLSPPASAELGDLSAFVVRKTGLDTLVLSVRGATCGGCLAKIERNVAALPGIEKVRMNLSTGRLFVAWRPEAGNADQVAACVTKLGYGASAYSDDETSQHRRSEERQLLVAMGVAAFALANIMLLSVSVWAGLGEMGAQTRTVLHALSGFIALPVLIFSGRHFFLSAYAALKRGRANMDVPISLALVLAFSVSVWETLLGGEHAYFDASIMLLFFLLIGRYLDARLRGQAHAAAHKLTVLRNRSVTRLNAFGVAESVRADRVQADDKILLSAGERAVIDMRVARGASSIDESLVTGESLPRTTQSGDIVYAGSVNLDFPLEGVALNTAADSLLSTIAEMLDAGEQKRVKYRQIADKAVSLYVPFVHSTAALALIAWLFVGAAPRDAIMVAVATLIITCPCALALAAPVAQVVASGRLFRSGVFLRSGDALERFAEIDHIVFDKTGTLTLGTPTLISSHGAELQHAARLARVSRHPLSRALVAAAGPGQIAENVFELPGKGVEGWIDGRQYRLGAPAWVGVKQTGAAPASGPTLWFGGEDCAAIEFRFRDRIHDDAAQTIAELERAGLSIEILSGDAPGAVAEVASQLSLASWQARMSPQDKVDRLGALDKAGKHVLMVGDGLNDAGALAMAHASLAPGGAMDISQTASDAVYSGGLGAVKTVLSLSRKTRTVMLKNFAFAAAYNFVAVPIAVTGHVTPLIAAIAMSASSLIVTLNALRINAMVKA